jgi:hypothetical protein
MEGKTIMLEFTEQEFALLHRALFELRGRPMISPEEFGALQSADQKMLKAARSAGIDLYRW